MTISELVDSVDLLEYVSQYTELTEKNGEYWGLSPLKDEETPSFSVNAEMNRFYDFSSGKGGDVLNFIKAHDHCGTSEAVGKLKRYAGVKDKLVSRREMESTKIAKLFRPRKQEKKVSKAVILPDDYMERYERDEEKLSIWESEGISRASLDKFQVRYDMVSDRIVYPVRSVDGRIINVSGRTTDPDWKAKKLRKYTYFGPLGIFDTVYGLWENMEAVREAHEIILFEGAKSVMLADTWGIHNTGALMTSHLNQYQLRILAKLGCQVTAALDKGVDVRDDKILRRLTRYTEVYYVSDDGYGLLEDKMAPVDAGREVWQKLYEGRRRLR